MMDELMTEVKLYFYEGKLYARKVYGNSEWYELAIGVDLGFTLKALSEDENKRLNNLYSWADRMRS